MKENSGFAYRIHVAATQLDTSMLLMGWLVKNGFYAQLATDTSSLGDPSRLPAAPEALLLDESIGANLLVPVLKCVRSDPRWAKTVVICLGAFSEEREVNLFKAGADDVMAKPLDRKSVV